MAKSGNKVFVDTGGWYAVVCESDRYHEAGVDYYRRILNEGARLITSDFVLDETITRLRYDISHVVALAFWRGAEAAAQQGQIEILRVDERVWSSAANVFAKFDDQDFSFTDCTSFVLAREAGVETVFAFDRHFSMFGFNVEPHIA